MYKLIALLASADARDTKTSASSARWGGLVALNGGRCVSSILRVPVDGPLERESPWNPNLPSFSAVGKHRSPCRLEHPA